MQHMHNQNISLLLFLKVEQGDQENVKVFLGNFPQLINEQNPKSGQTLLTVAARKCDLEMIKLLMEKGADINLANKSSQNALQIACFYASEQICQYLLKKGASPNQQDKKGCSPLMHACRNGSHKIIKDLIGSGATLDLVNKKGENIFDLAKDYETLQILTGMLGVDEVNVKQPVKIRGNTKHKKSMTLYTNEISKVVTSSSFDTDLNKSHLNQEHSQIKQTTPLKTKVSKSASQFYRNNDKSIDQSPSPKKVVNKYQSQIEAALNQIQKLFDQQFQVIRAYIQRNLSKIQDVDQLHKVIFQVPVGITKCDDNRMELQFNQFKSNLTKIVSLTLSSIISNTNIQEDLIVIIDQTKMEQQRKNLVIQQKFEPLEELPEEEQIKTPLARDINPYGKNNKHFTSQETKFLKQINQEEGGKKFNVN